MEIEFQARGARRARPALIQLKIEREALKKETDRPRGSGWRSWRRNWPSWRSKSASLTAALESREERSWPARRRSRRSSSSARSELEQAQRNGDLAARRRIDLRRDPRARTRQLEEAEGEAQHRMLNEVVDDERHRRRRLALDRHSGRQDAGGRARETAAHGRRALHDARGRPGRGDRRRLRTPCAARAPACRTPTARSARSCSWARPASARPS